MHTEDKKRKRNAQSKPRTTVQVVSRITQPPVTKLALHIGTNTMLALGFLESAVKTAGRF